MSNRYLGKFVTLSIAIQFRLHLILRLLYSAVFEFSDVGSVGLCEQWLIGIEQDLYKLFTCCALILDRVPLMD